MFTPYFQVIKTKRAVAVGAVDAVAAGLLGCESQGCSGQTAKKDPVQDRLTSPATSGTGKSKAEKIVDQQAP